MALSDITRTLSSTLWMSTTSWARMRFYGSDGAGGVQPASGKFIDQQSFTTAVRARHASSALTRSLPGVQVGDVYRDDRGNWVVASPSHCPKGHPLGPKLMLVGNQPCLCGGHVTWSCKQCWCTVYGPAIKPDCNTLAGPAAVTW